MSPDDKERKEAPDSEVVPTAKRRHFSAKEKRRILEEADACEYGEIGALVRGEGIYTSYLSRWRRERKRGELKGLNPKKRHPESEADKALVEENEKLRRENKRLKERLAQGEPSAKKVVLHCCLGKSIHHSWTLGPHNEKRWPPSSGAGQRRRLSGCRWKGGEHLVLIAPSSIRDPRSL